MEELQLPLFTDNTTFGFYVRNKKTQSTKHLK